MCLLELRRPALRGLLLVLNMEPDFVHVRFGCLARWLLVYFRVGARALALVSGLLVLALAAVAVCVATSVWSF